MEGLLCRVEEEERPEVAAAAAARDINIATGSSMIAHTPEWCELGTYVISSQPQRRVRFGLAPGGQARQLFATGPIGTQRPPYYGCSQIAA